MDWSRQLLGFALAPLTVPVCLIMLRLLSAKRIGLGYESDAFAGDVVFFGFLAYLVIGCCLVLPLMATFRKLKWAGPFFCSITGLVAWFILTLFLPPHYEAPIPDPDRLSLAVSLSIGGALAGSVFWMVAYWKPDVVRSRYGPRGGVRLK